VVYVTPGSLANRALCSAHAETPRAPLGITMVSMSWTDSQEPDPDLVETDEEIFARRLGADGRRSMKYLSGLLVASGVACLACAAFLTTDRYHTVLFAGLGLSALVGSVVLFWHSISSRKAPSA